MEGMAESRAETTASRKSGLPGADFLNPGWGFHTWKEGWRGCCCARAGVGCWVWVWVWVCEGVVAEAKELGVESRAGVMDGSCHGINERRRYISSF